MTGFVPLDWLPFADVRDKMGAETLGRLLAAGKINAFWQTAGGRIVQMTPEDWRGRHGQEFMERGLSFERRLRSNASFFPPGEKWAEETWPLFILAETLSTAPSPDHRPANDLVDQSARPYRAPRPADATDLNQTATDRALSSKGPMTLAEIISWAKDRGISRAWARDQHASLPENCRLKRGQHRAARPADK